VLEAIGLASCCPTVKNPYYGPTSWIQAVKGVDLELRRAATPAIVGLVVP
jgi:hypothetical protein